MARHPRPEDWQACYERGVAASELDNWMEAYGLFGRALTFSPDRWEPYYARALAAVRILSIEDEEEEPPAPDRDLYLADAANNLDRALDEFGGGSDAAALRGHVAALQQDNDGAVEYFLRAIGRSAQLNLVEYGLSDSLAALLADLESLADTDWRDAVAGCDRLERLLAAAPLNQSLGAELLAEILATRAYAHQVAGDNETAEADLRRVAQLTPSHPRAPESFLRDANRPATEAPAAGPAEPTFASVGGLDEPGTFMHSLRRLFELYFGNADGGAAHQRLGGRGRSSARSILLFGPSGCGKTYIIRSFAGEYRKRYRKDLPIVRLRLNSVLDLYVGESEKAITRLVDQAIELQPSILFADEIDAIGKSRERGQDWRVDLSAHWLQEVDRLHESGAVVVLVGCTNRVWAIDLAMLRRFDRLMPVELPGPTVRAQIFDVCLQQLDLGVGPAALDLSVLAEQSHGLTPGDIQKVVSRALDDLLSDADEESSERPLSQEDLLAALREYRQPMHVREWVRQSVIALRESGQDDMAEDVQRTYGPYIGDMTTLLRESGDGGPAWQQLPAGAWADQPEFDLRTMRQLWR